MFDKQHNFEYKLVACLRKEANQKSMIYITINSKDVKPIGYIVKEDST